MEHDCESSVSWTLRSSRDMSWWMDWVIDTQYGLIWHLSTQLRSGEWTLRPSRDMSWWMDGRMDCGDVCWWLTDRQYSQRYGTELSDAGMNPDGMTQSQHVATADFAHDLVTCAEIKQLKRIDVCCRHRQQWVLHCLDDPVVQNTPVALLHRHVITASSPTGNDYSDVKQESTLGSLNTGYKLHCVLKKELWNVLLHLCKNYFNINNNWYTQRAYDVIKLLYYKTVVYITFTTTTLKLCWI